MTFEQAMVLTRSVSSSTAFEDNECRLMFDLVSSLEKGSRIIEIGCQYGRSSSIILQAAPDETDMHFIDPFEDAETASKWMHMARLTSRQFTLHVCKSEDIIETRRFDLIHIDGDHSREGILEDLKWLNCYRTKAYACFHDFGRDSLPEVYSTVMDYFDADNIKHPRWYLYDHVGTLGVFKNTR